MSTARFSNSYDWREPPPSQDEVALKRIKEISNANGTELDLSNLYLRTLPSELWQLTQLKELYLRNNLISDLPPEIGKLVNLTTLQLSRNQLADLPHEIDQLTNLIMLDLGFNKFTNLPPKLWQLVNLTQFSAGGNQLAEIPSEIKHFTNLTLLYLFDNKLSTLPSEIWRLIKLTILYLQNNAFTSIPSDIGYLTNLTHLDLSYQGQKDDIYGQSVKSSESSPLNLPVELWKLANLKELQLNNIQLTNLPSEISELRNLNNLSLSKNQLTDLPPEIGKLVSLDSLDLSDNHFSELPSEIVDLPALSYLDLRSNDLASLQIKPGNLNKLIDLYLGDNQLTSLPPEISQLNSLKILDVGVNQINSLPPTIGNLIELSLLDAHENHLTNLPTEFKQLTNLTALNLQNNELTGLLTEICPLTHLVELLLGGNKLTSLPLEITQLRNLRSLDLSHNSLTNIPAEIGQLTNIVQLDISNNKLTSIPAEIGLLNSLEELLIQSDGLQYSDLDPKFRFISKYYPVTKRRFKGAASRLHYNEPTYHPVPKSAYSRPLPRPTPVPSSLSNRPKPFANLIPYLPEEIGNLRNLKKLNANSCGLQSLPKSITQLKNLRYLDCKGNPLKSIPPELLDKVFEPQIILTFLNWLWSEQPKTLAETKMLVVGQGSVGKTSLIRRLTGDIFNFQEAKTDGIAIVRWQVSNEQIDESQPATLRVNIWDFGGQEIMHATHQFFLTRRSLYLLVIDARLTQEENRVEYWLKIIQSFGGDSPVLLVGNKIDQHPLDIDRSGLQKKYPNIVGFLEASASTGVGLDTLESTIGEQVNKLPHVRDVLPSTWFHVKSQLEELGHKQNYISHEKYAEICTASEIGDETSQLVLLGLQHDLGIVLHFQDDPRLESLGILNPRWVTNGVYKILNSQVVFQNKGVLQFSTLAEILPEDEYPANKRLFIVDMMRKFELCYDIVPEQTFLVSDLLPKDEPYTGEWQGALGFQYNYNVLPSSIITRFIVRMNAYIHQTVWRSGVVLKKDDNTAVVKADTEERKIYIWVGGAENTRRDFLSVIRAEFDAIHKTIIKIEAIQKVPHPDYPDLVLDYAELLQFERDGIAEFPRSVNGRTVIVNVRQLLNGVRVGSEPVPVMERTASPAPVAVQSSAPVTVPAPQPSLPMKIVRWVFIELPKAIGRIPLDLAGKGKDAADSTSVALGYGIIILVLLIWLGYVGFDSLITLLKDIWRFFFPVKP